MATALLTFILMAVVIVIMSVGVIFGGKPVQGSCGGLNNIGGLDECDICGGDLKKCEQGSADEIFFDAAEERKG